MKIIPTVFTKTVAASATPEALGDDDTIFASVLFIAQKSYGTDNTGNVHLQVKNAAGTFTDALPLTPGQIQPFAMDPGFEYRQLKASDFKLRVETNGDGVRCVIFTM